MRAELVEFCVLTQRNLFRTLFLNQSDWFVWQRVSVLEARAVENKPENFRNKPVWVKNKTYVKILRDWYSILGAPPIDSYEYPKWGEIIVILVAQGAAVVKGAVEAFWETVRSVVLNQASSASAGRVFSQLNCICNTIGIDAHADTVCARLMMRVNCNIQNMKK